MTSSIRLLAVVLGSLLTLALLAGCGGGDAGGNGLTGAVQLRIHWPEGRAALPPNAAGVRITVTVNEVYFPSITRWVAQPEGASVTDVTLLGIPAGQALLRLEAYGTADEGMADQSSLLATGQTTLQITAGQQTPAAVTLTPVNQVGTVNGRVTDVEGAPLAGVTATTTDGITAWTATTDQDGYYALENIPVGQRVVSFSFVEWQTALQQTVLSGEPAQLDVTMTLGETFASEPPVIQVNEPTVNQEVGTALITGTISNVDAPYAVLVLNGNETLISLSQQAYARRASISVLDAWSFSTTAVLAPGHNTIRIRATNAQGTTISDPLGITFTPTTSDYLFRVTLSWDGGGDVDLHTWSPDLSHSYYGSKSIATGNLDVDNTYADGPENFTCSTLADGRFRIGVNAFDSAAGRNATIRVTVNHGPNAGQSYTFGPYAFTAYNSNSGYPITGNTDAWWRPCDIVVSGDTITAVAPDSTELPEGQAVDARARSKGRK